MENLACDYILSYFKDKNNEGKTPKELMILVLKQISAAHDLTLSTEETEENYMLERTQKFLKIKIDELKSMDLDFVDGNSFNDCIQYLEKIVQDTDEEPIKDRLSVFINELKNRYENVN